jgi:hypothetical protein
LLVLLRVAWQADAWPDFLQTEFGTMFKTFAIRTIRICLFFVIAAACFTFLFTW